MARRKVIEWLIHRLENEVDDAHFVMQRWLVKYKTGAVVHYRSEKDIPHCKTAGCIAGTLFLGLPADLRKAYVVHTNRWATDADFAANINDAASEQLGLTSQQASELFGPATELKKITRHHAIAVLKRMLTHSEINWKEVAPELIWPDCQKKIPITLTDN